MTYTTYSASQAVARAKNTYSWTHNYCLNFVMNMLTPTVASPYSSRLSDANAAWYYAQQKQTTGVPPAGAPVYWRSGTHGHIALSLGNGYVRSTDYPSFGRVGTVELWKLTNLWGMQYRGWSRDYAGLYISGLSGGSTTTSYSSTPTTLTNGGLTVADINDILKAIDQIPERVGYEQIGTTGKSLDTYVLGMSNWIADTNKKVVALDKKLDQILAVLATKA